MVNFEPPWNIYLVTICWFICHRFPLPASWPRSSSVKSLIGADPRVRPHLLTGWLIFSLPTCCPETTGRLSIFNMQIKGNSALPVLMDTGLRNAGPNWRIEGTGSAWRQREISTKQAGLIVDGQMKDEIRRITNRRDKDVLYKIRPVESTRSNEGFSQFRKWKSSVYTHDGTSMYRSKSQTRTLFDFIRYLLYRVPNIYNIPSKYLLEEILLWETSCKKIIGVPTVKKTLTVTWKRSTSRDTETQPPLNRACPIFQSINQLMKSCD